MTSRKTKDVIGFGGLLALIFIALNVIGIILDIYNFIYNSTGQGLIVKAPGDIISRAEYTGAFFLILYIIGAMTICLRKTENIDI